MTEVRKASPAHDYPVEAGAYVRGNDLSPVAVAVILRYDREKTPPSIERLVQSAVEGGAALAGTLQTENVGIEKIVCNLAGNPNIRHLIVFGPESPGHLVGDALVKLGANGMDGERRIVGAKALSPYLFNVDPGAVERFCRQVTVVDLVGEGGEDVLREAVRACYQEAPAPFRGLALWDPGAYPEPPLSAKIAWRVTDPTKEPKNDAERAQAEKLQAYMAKMKASLQARRRRGRP